MTHPNARLEAFCDAVFAIAMTLLIIEIKAPHLAHDATAGELWSALKSLLPHAFAFILSFGIILVTWVNHHEMMKVMERSSISFIYANGLLLLACVIMPFPTALLGNSLLTDHASPAVVLYCSVHAMQALGWTALTRSAKPLLNAASVEVVRGAERASYFAMTFYTASALLAFWLPHVSAAVITVAWVVWVVFYPLVLKRRLA